MAMSVYRESRKIGDETEEKLPILSLGTIDFISTLMLPERQLKSCKEAAKA